MMLLTMTLFLFLSDQRVATIQILLDKGILDLRNTLFQLPVCVHSGGNIVLVVQVTDGSHCFLLILLGRIKVKGSWRRPAGWRRGKSKLDHVYLQNTCADQKY